MSRRQARFELVHTHAGWTARFRASNGRIVMSSGSQAYSDKRGAENAIHLMARSFWGFASFGYDEIGRLFIEDRGERYVEVREADLR